GLRVRASSSCVPNRTVNTSSPAIDPSLSGWDIYPEAKSDPEHFINPLYLDRDIARSPTVATLTMCCSAVRVSRRVGLGRYRAVKPALERRDLFAATQESAESGPVRCGPPSPHQAPLTASYAEKATRNAINGRPGAACDALITSAASGRCSSRCRCR